MIKYHFSHQDSFLFAPLLLLFKSTVCILESMMFMHLLNTEVWIFHNSLSSENDLIYRQHRVKIWHFSLSSISGCIFHLPTIFPQESTMKQCGQEIFSKTHGLNLLWGPCGYLRRIKCVCLRAHLKNIAGIVYKDLLSRADINRQRPSLRKQCNMLALGTAAHGAHSLSSMVMQPRTGFCHSTGFLSLIGAAWIDWLGCSVNHPRIAPTQTWVHLVMNNCRNQCFPLQRGACVTHLKYSHIQNAVYNTFKIKTCTVWACCLHCVLPLWEFACWLWTGILSFRLIDPSGYLTDGPINYKYKTKCTWLIEG